MDITSFNRVVKFIIQTKATNSFYMPNTETITNMRVYNTTRAGRARTLAAQLVNTELEDILELVKRQNYPRAYKSFINMLETYQKNLLN